MRNGLRITTSVAFIATFLGSCMQVEPTEGRLCADITRQVAALNSTPPNACQAKINSKKAGDGTINYDVSFGLNYSDIRVEYQGTLGYKLKDGKYELDQISFKKIP